MFQNRATMGNLAAPRAYSMGQGGQGMPYQAPTAPLGGQPLPRPAAMPPQAATPTPGPAPAPTTPQPMNWLDKLFGSGGLPGGGMMGGFLGQLLGGDMGKVQSLLGGLDLSAGTPYAKPQSTAGAMQQGQNAQGWTTMGRPMPGQTQVPNYLPGQPTQFGSMFRNTFGG